MDGRKRKFILELQKKARTRRESGLYVIDGPKMAGEIPPEDADELFVTKEFLNSPHAAQCGGILKEKGYTVVTDSEMKQMSDTVSPQGILVTVHQKKVRGLEALLKLEDDPLMQGKQRILLVVTDASPNDSTPAAATDRLVPREYEGALGVRAAEEAVRHLRKNGLRVGAVFHGNPSHLGDLNQIFGHANVRIRKASQLAQGVSDLLLMLLREMQTD